MKGPTAIKAAAKSRNNERRLFQSANGSKMKSGRAEIQRGPKRISVAGHQRSPPRRITSHRAATKIKYPNETQRIISHSRNLSITLRHLPCEFSVQNLDCRLFWRVEGSSGRHRVHFHSPENQRKSLHISLIHQNCQPNLYI